VPVGHICNTLWHSVSHLALACCKKILATFETILVLIHGDISNSRIIFCSSRSGVVWLSCSPVLVPCERRLTCRRLRPALLCSSSSPCRVDSFVCLPVVVVLCESEERWRVVGCTLLFCSSSSPWSSSAPWEDRRRTCWARGGLSRDDFPPGFTFGADTSAYQVSAWLLDFDRC
jgi:hypothetical protein